MGNIKRRRGIGISWAVGALAAIVLSGLFGTMVAAGAAGSGSLSSESSVTVSGVVPPSVENGGLPTSNVVTIAPIPSGQAPLFDVTSLGTGSTVQRVTIFLVLGSSLVLGGVLGMLLLAWLHRRHERALLKLKQEVNAALKKELQ